MSFIEEESKKEAELRKRVEVAFGDDPDAPESLQSNYKTRARRAKEKEERAKRDYRQKQETLEHKRDKLEWQKERSKVKDEERKNIEKRRQERLARQEEEKNRVNIKTDTISDKDKDPTAYRKAIGNLASFSGGVAKLAAGAAKRAMEKRKERKEEDKRDAAEKASNRQKERTQAALSKSSKLLPPAKSLGQKARTDKNVRKREIEKRGGTVGEEFSCWREEFLYELGDMRKKKKKNNRDDGDYIVDVMKGKNKVVIGPTIKENTLIEKKRDHLANALLGLAFAASAAQSPKDLVRAGHIESPGIQLMNRMMTKRKEADRNLDSGRVSHPARNRKTKTIKEFTENSDELQESSSNVVTNKRTRITANRITEALDKKKLLAAIVKKLIDEKKRKNYLLNYGYIGEAKYDKSNLKCNSPKSDPVGSGETGKSHVVKACEGGTEKLIRFGQRGVKGSPKKKGESKAYASRRKRFKARHAKNIAKGKMSASWWSNYVKW